MKKVSIVFALVTVASLYLSCGASKELNEIKKLSDSERYADAIELANKAIDKYPNDARLYYQRGWCYYCINNYYRAQNDFEKCIKIDEKNADGYKGLATIYRLKGMYDLAEKNFDKALELAPNSKRKAAITDNLAFLYLDGKHDYKKAIELYLKSIEFDDIGDVYYDLGEAYIKNNQKKEAEQTWLKAINEKNFEEIKFKHYIYHQLAIYYFQEKDYKKSKEMIEKAIELSPNENQYLYFFNTVKNYVK